VPIEGTLIDPHILASIEVRHTGSNLKGYGAYAIADIDEDVFLGFYEGTKIESREALDAVIRERRKKAGPKCDSASDYIMNVDGGVTFIDGFERAQDKSLFSTVHLNHADQESLNCNVIRLLEDDRIAFFTSQFIHAGEELCFDYGSNFWRGKEQNKI
jgi:SET domain-containing protein